MELGAFSVSLAVESLTASREFYAKLGFRVIGGDGENWQILRSDATTIGLFQGMFDSNILTFNPSWDATGAELENFTDAREIQRELKAQALPIEGEVDEASSGPASFMLTDPDGNRILIDQHR